MAHEIKMFARRSGSDFDIYADGSRIGTLADCEIAHIFISEDDEFAKHVHSRIEADMLISERLVVIREVYEYRLANGMPFKADNTVMDIYHLRQYIEDASEPTKDYEF